MDAAEMDALEKATRTDWTGVQQCKSELLGDLAGSPHKAVRWHVAQLLPRLRVTGVEHRRRVAILTGWLEKDSSAIGRVNALQALSDVARDDPRLGEVLDRHIRACLSDRSAAVRARARLLARRLP